MLRRDLAACLGQMVGLSSSTAVANPNSASEESERVLHPRERGNATGVSESVIEEIALALQLDEAERAHLVRLLHAAGTTRPPRRRPVQRQVRGTVQRVLDSMVGSPAFVLNGRGDILAANALGRALFAPVPEASPANLTRNVFLDPQAATFFRDCHTVATDTVAILRAETGRDPDDRRLSDLVGELSTRSEEFRFRWAAHDVKVPPAAPKLLRHPVVGDLDIQFESMQLPGDADQSHPATRRVSGEELVRMAVAD